MKRNMSETGLDFSAYIAERTRNFIGSEWVFAEVDKWLVEPDGARVFLLTGGPGSGKRADAARLAQMSLRGSDTSTVTYSSGI